MKKFLLTLVLVVCSVQLSLAQRFPVTVVPQVNPPAPVNFHNYADATTINSPLQVQLLLSDISVSNLQVRLKVSFEGNGISFESRDLVVGAQPLFIDGGSPLTLRNTDLGPYFEFQNLQGINANLYGQTIPEGSYQFCFEVFEFVTGNRLSSKTCATTYIFKNEPPILNLPLDGINMEPQAVDNIVFQWTPRHINVSNVEYELSIVEIWDDGVDPQTAFLSSPPIFQTTTRANSFVYGPAQPQLLNDKRYAWQVQAKALQGAEEIGLFKNEGKSEIFWFSKVEPCETPFNVSAEPKGISKMNVYWDEDPTIYTEYTIAYREADRENARWFTMRTNSGWATVWDLKPGTTYEYKVKGKCKYQYSEYTQPQTITTETAQDETANYNCGIVPDEIAITNREPVANILVGDRITAGDFVITITDIESESNGRITGVGYVRVPYFELARFAVRFNGILINTDYQLAEGEIVTLYDPKFGADAQMTVDIDTNIGEAVTGDQGGTDDQKVDFVISSVEIDSNGAIVIKGENGEEAIIPGGRDITITDSEGTPWTVGEDGTITKGEGAEGGAATAGNTTGIDENGASQISAKGVRVDFENSGYYYFDEVPSSVASKLTEEYKTITISDGGEYTVPHKAVSNIAGHAQDILTARATFTDSEITKDDIIFKTKDGVKVDASWSGDVATLTLVRKFDYAIEEVLATVKPKDTSDQYSVAGVFNMVHLASQEVTDINITLVPIQRVGLDESLKAQINEIYNKAGVNFNITIEEPLDINKGDWDLDGNNQLDIGDSSLLAQYTEEERAIYKYYKSKRSYDKKRYYVFVLGNGIPPSKTNVQGFMPLNRQYGFVFDPNNLAKTIAHELGHGIFGLEHPWDTYGFTPESTNWLMDNKDNGTVLNHMDWKKMHAPGIQLYMFQDDEDGEYASYQHIIGYTVVPGLFSEKIGHQGSDFLSFVSYAGKIFSIPSTATDVTFGENGVLYAFTIPENGGLERYIALQYTDKATSEKRFAGYLKESGTTSTRQNRMHKDYSTKGINGNSASVYLGFLSRNGSECGIKVFNASYDKSDITPPWNSGGEKLPMVSVSTILSKLKSSFNTDSETVYGNKLEFNRTVDSPEACTLSCDKGKEFYEVHGENIADAKVRDIVFKISTLICDPKIETSFFDEFSEKGYNNLLEWQKNFYNQGNWPNDYEAYKKFYDSYEKYVKYYLKVKSIIKTSKDREALLRIAYNLSLNQLKTLSSAEKLKMLQIIASESMGGFLTGINYNEEYLALKIINSINDEKDEKDQVNKFLEGLSSDTYKVNDEDLLYVALFDRIDDFFGKSNFTALIIKLTELSLQNKGLSTNGDLTAEQIETNSKAKILWDVENKQFLWIFNVVEDKTNVDVEVNDDQKSIHIKYNCIDRGKGRNRRYCNKYEVDDDFKPFDFVSLNIIKDLAFNPDDASVVPQGQGTLVPAIFMEYLATKRSNAITTNVITNTLTIASFYFSGGTIISARGALTLKTLPAYADLFVTMFNPYFSGPDFARHASTALQATFDVDQKTADELAKGMQIVWTVTSTGFTLATAKDVATPSKHIEAIATYKALVKKIGNEIDAARFLAKEKKLAEETIEGFKKAEQELIKAGKVTRKQLDEAVEAAEKRMAALVKRKDHLGELIAQSQKALDNEIDEALKAASNSTKQIDEFKVVDEIVETDQTIMDATRKFWQNHEENVFNHLVNKYNGAKNVGRQITVDITITQANGTKITKQLRFDNLVNVGEGKPFKIIDAKSSVRKELSTFTSNDLATKTSTPNQEWFYKALKESSNTIEISPRGQRAKDFFGRIDRLENNALPNSIPFEKNIDFFVNTKVINDTYDIYKIIH
ncbi:fibronectin type III domain-containing protein [Aquimarina gracilis]|uniref:Fibronectin type III domain-containing protein n=1 Tax=Aquimarina gracilis TaxID=874422 RepID=A0ABU5ZUL5_9FLAO|nr:fibronectin type III domain-containing protein [Aquimarina gracilis]MEB3345777.1 fibronectin type III domain-containing protein [Aquimarina gracilis]